MGKGRNLHIPCGKCGAELNTWDARCSKALGYRNILVCEACICKEYDVDKNRLRSVMEERFGLVPCQGL